MSRGASQSAAESLVMQREGLCVCSENAVRGDVLIMAKQCSVESEAVVLDGKRFRHSETPSAAFIEGRLVAVRPLHADEEITVNGNLLVFRSAEGSSGSVCGFVGLSDEKRHELMMFVDPSVRSEAVEAGYVMQSSSPHVTVRANGEMGQATFAKEAITAGTRFFLTEGLVLPFPTVYTIMLGGGKHLLFAGGAQCLAHSCDPNVRIEVNPDQGTFEVVALRDIEEGQLIAFNYLTTEWDMDAPFPCLCGSERCFRMIRGYKHLTPEQKAQLTGLVTKGVLDLTTTGSIALPSTLFLEERSIVARAAIPRGTVLFECSQYTVQPTHIDLFGAIIAHSDTPNTVLVEGQLVAFQSLAAQDVLTVNMCFFMYDMISMFPDTYSETCKGFKYLDDSVKQRNLYLCEPPVRAQAMHDGWTVKSSNQSVIVRPVGAMGQTAFATAPIAKGTTLFNATGLLIPFPTMYTICVGEKEHLLFGDAAECIAHHCDPNVCVVVQGNGTFKMIAVRDIGVDEMLTFNYATTEWDMNSSFACLCGSRVCAGMMRGFKYLLDEDRRRLWLLTSDYIKKLAGTGKPSAIEPNVISRPGQDAVTKRLRPLESPIKHAVGV